MKNFRKSLLAGTALVGMGLAGLGLVSIEVAAQQVITYNNSDELFNDIDATTQDTILQTILGGVEIAIQAGDITTEAPFTLTIDVIDVDDELAITGSIIGDGPITVMGAGNLFLFETSSNLTGPISLAGTGTVFSAGTNAFGDSVITFNNDGASLGAFDGVIVSNEIILATDGTLTTPSTAGIDVTFSGDIDLMGNTLIFNPVSDDDILNVSGDISGAGGLSFIGPGFVRISGNSTFAGGVSLDGDGAIFANSDTGFGTGTITFNNANAVIEVGNGVNIGNAVDLVTDGTIQTGVTGVEVAEFSGNIDTMGNSLTVFGGALDEFTISGIISGTGNVTVAGGADIIFAGINTYTGGTEVTGDLLVTGSITGLVSVGGTASLGGTGTVDDIEVTGVVTPGLSIGTLTVNNDATFNSSSMFSVELDAGGTNDLLSVGGAVTINSGSTVEAILLPGQFTVGQTYTIMTSGGGITGTFDSVTSSLAFIEIGITHNANDVELEIINIITLATILDEASYGTAVGVANAATDVNAIDFDNLAVINMTADASAFALGDGNSMFLLGNDATINGNGFTALQLSSGTLNISNLTINGTVQLDGGILALGSDISIGTLGGATGAEIALNDLTLTINDDTDSTFSGIFTGDGAVIKTGTGVLNLTEDSTFTGGFTLSGDGGVIAESDDVFGSGVLTFDNANTSLIIEDGSNVGNDIVMNTDALIRSFPGDPAIDDDTILDVDGNVVKETSISSSDIDTMGNVLTIDSVDEDDQINFVGDISGAGNVVIMGPGTVFMNGPSTYTGGTSLEGEGTTFVGRAEALGTGTVTFNNAMASLGLIDSVAIDNAIDLATDGRLQTLENDAVVSEVNGDINTMGNSLVVDSIEANDQLTLGGIISGAGDVTVNGLGVTIFSGVSTYSGGTTVDTGTLLVNGSIAGPTTVNVDGTLGGTGTINGATTISGTLAPGESIGSLSHVGNASFETGSFFEVETNIDGTADFLDVTGTLTLNGGTLLVAPETNSFVNMPDYTVATATGGISGMLEGTDSTLSFLLPTYEVDGNDLVVSIDLAKIEPSAVTANQTGFAAMFDNELETNEELSDDIIEALNALYTDLSAAPENLDQLTGEGISTFSAISIEQVNIRNRTLTRHINESRRCYAGHKEGATFNPNCELAGVQSRRGPSLTRFGEVRPQTAFWGNGILWLNGYGGVATGSSAKVGNFHVVGFDMGYDRWVSGSFLLGFSTGYVRTQGNNFGSVARGETEYGHISMHGSFSLPGAFYANGILTASFGDMETSRNITIEDLSRTANALMTGKTVSGFVEVGMDNYMGGFQVQPYATLQYAYVQRNGFTETGAGDLNLTVASEKFNSMQASVGVRASAVIKVTKSFTIRPEVRAGYIKEFGDANGTLISKVDLLTLPAASMDITSVTPFADGISFGASLDFRTSEKFHFVLDYDALLSSLYDIHTGTSRLQWLF